MLFQTENVIESEKERNLYSKVFAGYYFNELIPGYESRLQGFADLICGKELKFSGSIDKQFRLSKESTHVTFDFHAYLVNKDNDRGELADILVADIANKSAAAIEVKFLENWNFDNDIWKPKRRIESLFKGNRLLYFVHVLLVTQSKLDSVRRMATSERSHWRKLSAAELGYPLVVVTWEEISMNCKGPEGELVKEFIKQSLRKSKKQYRKQTRNVIGVG